MTTETITCPTCKSLISVDFNLTGKGIIKEGDVVFCESDNQFLICQNDRKLRRFTDEEIRRMKADDPLTYDFLVQARDKIKITKGIPSDSNQHGVMGTVS